MRNLILVTALFSSTILFAATPCKPAVEHTKLDQAATQTIQKKVNLGGEPWRLDAKEVAARQVESMDATLKAPVVKAWLKTVKSDEHTQVLSYKTEDRTYEITMRKPEWLLPYASIYKTMIWNVTDVTTTCPAVTNAPAKKPAAATK